MFNRRKRTCAGSAVVAADEHFIGITLGNARGNRSYTHFGNKLDRYSHPWIAALEVIYELCQVLNGIYVVMRRR